VNYIYYVAAAGVRTAPTAVVPEVPPYDKTSSSIFDFFYAF
jgi:hypothetical protein